MVEKEKKEEKETLEKRRELIKEEQKLSKWKIIKSKIGSSFIGKVLGATAYHSLEGIKEHGRSYKSGNIDVKGTIILGIVLHLLNIFYFDFEINGLTILLNILIAIVTWITVFDEDLTTIIVGLICILISLNLISSFGQIGISLAGNISGMIISFGLIILIIVLISKKILGREIDWNGIIIVLIVFLLQLGVLTWIFNKFNLDNYVTNKAFLSPIIWPWWVILGAILGAKTKSTFAKIIFYLLLAWVFFMIIFYNPTTVYADFSKLSDIQKKEINEDLKKTVSSRWDNFKKSTAQITCAWQGLTSVEQYDICINEKTKITKELTEEEKFLAIPNKKKQKKIDLFFNNIDAGRIFYSEENENYKNIRISTQLKGQSIINKLILLACSINEVKGIITYPGSTDTTIEENNLNWWQDIECQPTEKLKKENDVEFLAKWRQYPDTEFPNYFMELNELNEILSKYKTAEYVEIEKKCQYQDREECLSDLRKMFYPKITEFKKITTDYPNFEMVSKYDDESAALIIKNTALETESVIGVEDEKAFRLRFAVLNNNQGEIVKVYSIKIEIPKFIDSSRCEILENGMLKKEILELIDWSKVKYNEKKIIPGTCELIIKGIKDFRRVEIRGKIDFEYQLKGKFKVIVR